MSKIEIRGLYKVFGKDPQQALSLLHQGHKSRQEIFEQSGNAVGLDNVSFDVEEGEILVVMGLSGSGKSTLIRCINRLFEPTAGSITINGEEITALDAEALRRFRRDTFGMVFQQFALLPHRSVIANVEYGLEIQQLPTDERADKARQALQLVGLEGWEEAFPDQLSGGMQQRVGLARALAIDPDILLMDEAFSALDPLIRRAMQDELLALQDKMHKTILFVSHDLDEAVRIGDRIVLMKDGAIVQVGTPAEILTSPANSYVEQFVGDINIANVLTAGAVLIPAKATITPHETLEHARAKMDAMNFSDMLVVDDHHELQGIVRRSDLLAATDRPDVAVDEVMHSELPVVTLETPLPEMFQLFSDWHGPLPAIDDRRRLLGIVRKTDIMQALARENGAEQ
jgi:glycine betaine/proline transport system ATP-binding protein